LKMMKQSWIISAVILWKIGTQSTKSCDII
jgi:hypothetical protein